MKNSNFGSLNLADFFKGLIVAVLTSIVTLAYQMLLLGSLDFKAIGMVALISTLGYLLKQLSTNSEGEIFSKESIIGGRPNDR